MTDEVAMMIRCDNCEQAWDIDHDPETCTCESDADWQLMCIPVDG